MGFISPLAHVIFRETVFLEIVVDVSCLNQGFSTRVKGAADVVNILSMQYIFWFAFMASVSTGIPIRFSSKIVLCESFTCLFTLPIEPDEEYQQSHS
jgi:hypothetical protein